ncbi:GNAT family N-acetyltransferase [Prosthecobacter sp.]|uniref:GNAT family N-acetyltransferase n=1 Tax=Prosthecobacter sp. TaxID=1965333 RepID=UPI003782FC58
MNDITPARLRHATEADIPAMEGLIPLSVHGLQANCYSLAQRQAALGPVFGVDTAMLLDRTYFVIELEGNVVGCGGWSRRKTLFGGDQSCVREDVFLNPATDAARVRAFFIHPDFARRGYGSAILKRCEDEMRRAGFTRAVMVATLAGEPLYARFGYAVEERYDVPMGGGLFLPVVRMSKSLSLA